MARRKNSRRSTVNGGGLSAVLRRPPAQLTVIALAALLIYVIAASSGGASLPLEVSVDQGYQMYQQENVFVLDVRTPEEWHEYHAPNTTLIPLDQLTARIHEVPKDKDILVVCRSGNRSRQGRDILLAAGYNATSMAGGLREWYARRYPIEGAPR